MFWGGFGMVWRTLLENCWAECWDMFRGIWGCFGEGFMGVFRGENKIEEAYMKTIKPS